jgi:hypothetical protein
MRDLLQNGDSISYPSLVRFRRSSLRNGHWKHLRIEDRALFRCAFWMARVRGKISNAKLVVQVLKIALKLVEGVRGAILRIGMRRTMQMFETYAKPGGVFSWAPQARGWLSDARYVWYFGVVGVNP